MQPSELEAIKICHNNDPDECFKEMLSTWLKQVELELTWRTLANALKSPTVGLDNLSEKVKRKFLYASASTNFESSRNPQSQIQLQADDLNDFQCPCGRCDLMSYLEKGCPKTTSHSYPYLALDHLNDDDREDLIQKLSDDTANIIQCFADLLSNTSESLKSRGIAVSQLIKVALDLGAYKSGRNPLPLLNENRTELQEAKSVDDAFIILGKHMSFFNYEILGHILRHLGDDNDNKKFESYCSQFKVFCEHKLFEVSPGVFYPSGTENRKNCRLFVVLGTKDLFETLADVKAAQRKVASLLGLRASTVQLKLIDNGSIILVFSIPMALSDIFPIKQATLEKFKSLGYTLIVPSAPSFAEIQVPTHQQLGKVNLCNTSIMSFAIKVLILCCRPMNLDTLLSSSCQKSNM